MPDLYQRGQISPAPIGKSKVADDTQLRKFLQLTSLMGAE